MGNNDLVNDHCLGVYRNRKLLGLFGVKKDLAPTPKIPLSTVRSVDLFVDRAPLPAVPTNLRVFFLCELGKLLFTIEKMNT
jgi:hypothetical protein